VDNTEFPLKIGHENLSIDKDAKVQAVIWTTTPWTLPSNKAIAFHKSEQYSLLDAREGHKNVYYIVVSALQNQFFAERNKSYNIVLEFSGNFC
jgi:isoleucyl-tRNA synthetase